ncbi:hypothetical protein G7Y89_g7383 [Cudoniella acicularis]|uniref:NmrA-like domain-containing protein n=1 Tax=Cudoniella acicularis TaxID=354080 RepID=A0A8H4RK78_9HELO|nr:hypothetical protein G7Y89_g7383 [Cudoniella acicularis]
MTYSILLLGATGFIGSLIAAELAILKEQKLLERTAFLTSTSSPEKEAKYAAVPLERITGSLTDPASYRGFDIVISAVGDDLCAQQVEFIDAAFEGGVRHFYPTEFGADLSHPVSLPEAYFKNKIATRKHLEARVAADPTKGYTYILVGLFTEVFLAYNALGLSEDRRSARIIGAPGERVSITSAQDVAKITATSLLPSHLPSLSTRREIRFAGETLTLSSLFSTVENVVGHKVDVEYIVKVGVGYFRKGEGVSLI